MAKVLSKYILTCFQVMCFNDIYVDKIIYNFGNLGMDRFLFIWECKRQRERGGWDRGREGGKEGNQNHGKKSGNSIILIHTEYLKRYHLGKGREVLKDSKQ